MNIENNQMYKVQCSIKYINDNDQNRSTFNPLYSLYILLVYYSHYLSHILSYVFQLITLTLKSSYVMLITKLFNNKLETVFVIYA